MSWPASVAQNTNALIEWDGLAPFTLIMKQHVGSGIQVLDTVQGLSENSFNWKVTAPSGSTIFFTLSDASPNTVDSADLPVKPDPAIAASSRSAAASASAVSASKAAEASVSALSQSILFSSIAVAQSSQLAAQASALSAAQSRLIQTSMTATATNVAPQVSATSLSAHTPPTSSPTATSTPSVSRSNTRARTLIIIISSVSGALVLVLSVAIFVWVRKVREPIHQRRTLTGYENSFDSWFDLEKSTRTPLRPGHGPSASFESDSTAVSATPPTSKYKSPTRPLPPHTQPPSRAWIRGESFRTTVTDQERDQDPQYMGRLTRTYNELVDALASTPAPPLPSPTGSTLSRGTHQSRASMYRSLSLRSKQSAASGESSATLPGTLADYESEGSHYPATSEEALCNTSAESPIPVMSPTRPLRFERKQVASAS